MPSHLNLLFGMPIGDPVSPALLAVVYTGAAVLSGLSGFGFAAIGALSPIVLPPQLGIPLLMALSLATQSTSLRVLWRDLGAHVWGGCGPSDCNPRTRAP